MCVCVRHGCDVTSATCTLGTRLYINTITRTLRTSLLTVERGHGQLAIWRHSHSYRRATKAVQTTLEQAKTVLSTSRPLSQATKVRLRYKRVDFLGTANRNFQCDLHRR